MDAYFIVKKLLEEQEKTIKSGNFNSEIFNCIQNNSEYLFMKMPVSGMEDIKLLYCKLISDALNKGIISEQQFSSYYKSIVKRYDNVVKLRTKASEISSCIENLYAYGRLSENNVFADVSLRSLRNLLQLPAKLKDYINSHEFKIEVYSYLSALHDCYSDDSSTNAYYSKACEALSFIVELGMISDEESDRIKNDFINSLKSDFCSVLRDILDIKPSATMTSEFGG